MFSWFEKRVNAFPREEIEIPKNAFFSFIFEATKGLRLYIVGMGVLGALVGVFDAILVAGVGAVVDWLVNVSPQDFFKTQEYNIVIVLAILALSIPLVFFDTVVRFQIVTANFSMKLRWNFHRLMLGQSMSFFQDEYAGRVTTKVMQTGQAIRDFYVIIMNILIYAITYFFTILLTLLTFDKWTLIPFVVWFFLYLLVLRFIVPRLAASSQDQADANSNVVGRMTDSYTNIATVKLFSHGKREAEYTRDAMSGFLHATYGLLRNVASFEILNHLLGIFLILSSLGLTLFLWSKGEVTMGAVAAVASMSIRLRGLSNWIMWESTQLFENVGTIYDGMKMFSQKRKVVDVKDAKELSVKNGEIVFDRVSFSYSKENLRFVIRDFSLRIKSGEKIGLVGRSGAGKSTLVNLLLRFHDLSEGKIFIDGEDISLVSQESLRSQIGMVMQDTSLLHRSVKDNIIYGRPDASEEEIEKAVRRAEADEFISGLLDASGRRGYDAHVGERGVKLSGGQRQRIALSRVMLKDAPILLLDEATSALDSEIELAIQENLSKLMKGKTVLAIAHRLSTIAAMDRLVVIDEGKIVEVGDHETLLKREGLYAKLWGHQSGGFLSSEV